MKVCLWIALGWLFAPSLLAAEELMHLGDFDNVSSRDGGEHCSGYSLELWKLDGRVFGLLDVHSGLCGDPPCAVIRDVIFNPKTGHLAFWSFIQSEKIDFTGTLKPESVVGTINGESVQLRRERESSGTFESNTNLKAWCSFWITVPRCAGVKELCQSIATSDKSGG